MDRFKVGDKVTTSKGHHWFKVGTELVIIRVDGDGVPMAERISDGFSSHVDDHKLEYSHIYNSPLWKALG